MINVIERNSVKDVDEFKDYEYYNLSSETPKIRDLKDNVNFIENIIISYINSHKLNSDYKILGLQPTDFKEEGKYYIFTNDMILIDGVKGLLTGKNLYIEFLPLANKSSSIKSTSFKKMSQLWCNKLREYFDIEFDFSGIIKLTAVKVGNKQTFDFTASGKGTTDEIVRLIKKFNYILEDNELFYSANVGNIINLINEKLN